MITKVNILQLSVEYQIPTIDRRTWKPEPQTGNDKCSQTRQSRWVDGYRNQFGQPRSSRSGFSMGLQVNLPNVPAWTHTAGWFPQPVANTNKHATVDLMQSQYHLSSANRRPSRESECSHWTLLEGVYGSLPNRVGQPITIGRIHL